MTRHDLFRRLSSAARRAHEDEEGSSMIFGAITLFTLALFTVMVWVIGMNSGDRLQNQTASDSAAYSGALVEAEALESIAFLNDGMAYVYYTECRYAVDAIVYSTLQAFHEHDTWVTSHQPNRVQNSANSPGFAVEDSVGSQHNNPGARAGQNYTPGIEPGGVMASSSGNPAQPQDYGFVEMGDAGGPRAKLFEERFANAMGRAQALLPRGKRWLADIHFAERVILYATPQLVKKTCIKIALDNGAEWVAVSSDLDDAFELASNNQDAGFTDGSDSPGMNGGMVNRYGGNNVANKSNPIDKKPRPLPDWFDPIAGNIVQTGFSQVRLCWNKRDWDHCVVQGNYSDHMGYPFSQGSPAGHWHVAHVHKLDGLAGGEVYDLGYGYGELAEGGPYTHDYGHGMIDGPDAGQHAVDGPVASQNMSPGLVTMASNGYVRLADSETSDPGSAHHMAQTCPTCAASGSSWGEVTHSFNGADNGGTWALQQAGYNPTDMTTVHFNGGSEVTPRPILLKGRALRSGVTVATWRHSRGLTPQHFPANDFGCFAIASAQVGIRDPQTNMVAVAQTADDKQATFVYSNGQTRTVALNAGTKDQGTENFYLGSDEQGDQGLRFGARLVPIRRELTWSGVNASQGGAAARGLQDLLYGQRWWSSVPNGAIARNGTRPDPANDDLGKALDALRSFVNVAQSPKAFAQ